MFMKFCRKHAHAPWTDSFHVIQVMVILATDSQNELTIFTASEFKESQRGHINFTYNLVETEDYISLETASLRP